MSARAVAEAALARVLEDGAYASAALEAEIERFPQLDARERALATQLVYGTLRVFYFLERELDAHAKRSVTKLRPRVRVALAVAAYQILFLDRIPAYAAVSEAASSVREVSDDKVAGFANAILRKLAASVEQRGRRELGPALRASIPGWLFKGLRRTAGDANVDAVLAAGDGAPPIGLAAPSEAARDTWLDRLRAEHPTAELGKGAVSPLAIVVRGIGKPQVLSGVTSGELVVQEEGSQLVALALGVAPGERVLDACAGRGHKTVLLAHAAIGGQVDAADLHENKLVRLSEEFAKSGLAPPSTFAVDWSVGAGDVPEGYDAVLVDAPCSGTGTLRRRPDIVLRRKKEDIAELAALQKAILRQAATRVRPGGRLVYAVCSLLAEEAEDVVAGAGLEGLGFRPAPFAGRAASAIFGDAPQGRLLPHVHGTDGYFVASFSRP